MRRRCRVTESYGRIQDRVISVMLSHGCKIVQTPSFEDYDSYGTYFPSLRKEMIKTIDSDGSVLVLRPDVTLPLVKAAAIEFPDGSELLKYGYVTTVFRNYYGMTSHGRDFLQAGVEVLGDPTPECDGEVIVTAAEFLESVGIESMRIDLGTVAYMDALFEALELSERQADELRSCMEKRNLVTFQEIAESLPPFGQASHGASGAAFAFRAVRADDVAGAFALSERTDGSGARPDQPGV